jgi:hypothetical protein
VLEIMFSLGGEFVEPDSHEMVVVDQDDLEAVRELAERNEVSIAEVPLRGIEPITTITLVLLGTPAAVGTVSHLIDQFKGGQVIDVRPGAPKAFYRTKDVVYGLVVVVAADGKVTVEVKEPKGLFGQVAELVRNISLQGDGTSAQIEEQVSSALGDSVSVAVQRISQEGGM